MSDTLEFQPVKKNFTFVVKKEFLKQCPNPGDYDVHDLMTKYKMAQYFHNPTGPAITRFDNGKVTQVNYWINGQILSQEEGEKIAHAHKFNEKLLTTLASDDAG